MIKLGSFVIDQVTGLEGIAENRASYLYGCDRYFVQPQVDKDGKVPEGRMVDDPQLKVTDAPPVMEPMPAPAQTVPLGAIVDDPIRGQKGTATGRAVYLNGCSRIFIESKLGMTNVSPDSWWVDEQQLVIKKLPKKPQVKETRTGGPARSCSKY